MNLQHKIDKKREEITRKKNHLEDEFRTTKKNIVSPVTVGLTTLSGFLIGYFLVPNKIVKTIFKIATLATTARQVLELLPAQKKAHLQEHRDKAKAKLKG